MSYQDWFLRVEKELQRLRKQGVQLAANVIGQTLYEDDFYTVIILDKCTRLIDGFIDMLEKRNLACAGILLRIQIDNCMRMYAFYVAENRSEISRSVYGDGKQINRMKAKDGKLMTDFYLRKELSKIDKRFDSVYKAASGYIHYSEKAFYASVSVKEPNILDINVGHPIPEELDSVLQECAEAYIFFVKFQYELSVPIVESKNRIDAQ